MERINEVKRESHSYIKIDQNIYTPDTTAHDFRTRSKYFMTINKAPEVALKINSQSCGNFEIKFTRNIITAI